ncbi:uncharacterized protein LOC129882392 isoform X1 [Solanum dulcamara]|uniref:uncharacterized protein LOC129882392 isoform X1 n=1 Tax=Solanum dulcamara TaxID=45834 RepID=UPI002486944B|nr:uncharacterized protein LOC129882392 isoform X1 [Solanum dulcamara]
MFAKKLFQKATQYHHHHQTNGSGLTASDLNVRATVHYGIPSTSSILAVDSVQRLLAIGTLDGRIKVIGGDNIEGLLISPKQLPYKYLEFLQNQGFLVSITNENDIQVWNLKSRSVACDLQWESNITAFSVINGSSFMYVGDEYGTISVLKFCVESRELLQLPYQILWSSLSEAAGFPYSDHQPVVGILPQPFTSGNRLLIAYECGLIILWDVIEAHVIIVKGDKDLHLKDGALNFKQNADSSSPDDLLQHQFEEKEITTLCWASTDGSILAAGYIDGDILLWKTSKSTASKGQEAGPFDNVVKLQLSSVEKRLPIIVLHWWANSKSRNNSDGHLLIYGGDEIGSDEVITILTLEWSSGMETLKCVGRVDLTLSGSFADTILLPTTGTTATDEKAALFVLMSPGQLNLFDCSTLSDLVSKEEKKISLSAKDFPLELPTVDPSMTVTKLTQLHSDGNLTETPFFKKFSAATSSGASRWPLTGGVYNHTSQAETNRIQRVFIAGYQDGSVRMWDATHPVFLLLCLLDREVKCVNTVISSASVSKIDFCFQTLRLAVGDASGLVRLYDFKHSDMGNLHVVTDTKSEVHELAQGQGPTCRAVLKLLDVRVRAIEFVNHGAKLAVGYENAKVAVLDVTSLSVLFLSDSASVGISPLVTLIAKSFVHSDRTSKSPKQSELPENRMEELMFILTEDAKIYVIDGGNGKIYGSGPLHLKKVSTAISMYVIENNTPVSDIISKQPESSKDDAASNEPSQEMTSRDLSDTVPFLENDPSRKHFEESFILLCCKDSIRTYATKSVVHGDNKSVCKVKLDEPCCWTTTFMKDGKACALLLLFQTGDIEIRSLPDLELVERTSLMSVLRWNFKPNMDRAISSMENGHITLANGSELAFMSLLASENDFRIPESLPSLHDEVLAAAADAAMKFSTQKKKQTSLQGGGPNILGTLVKGFKAGKTNHNMDLSQMSKSNFSHLEGVFMKNALHPEPSPTKEGLEEVELDIDDIEIDEPVPVVSTSSHSTQNSKRGTEREKLLDSEGDDAKPRLRTREEIIAKYRKTGAQDASSAAGQARDKLLERQEKLERISQRTEELRNGAEDFASLANELVKVMENRNRKWWQI